MTSDPLIKVLQQKQNTGERNQPHLSVWFLYPKASFSVGGRNPNVFSNSSAAAGGVKVL